MVGKGIKIHFPKWIRERETGQIERVPSEEDPTRERKGESGAGEGREGGGDQSVNFWGH